MKTAIINNYQDDFDNSPTVEFPAEIVAANDFINEGDTTLEILLTHPHPYEVQFLENSELKCKQYFQTLEGAERAKAEYLHPIIQENN